MAPTATPERQTSNPERTVPTRRMDFEPSFRDVPKHFAADGDLLSSHLAASMSSMFPDGEDFFVRSVRHYRKQITDPELKKQVAGFIGQEAIHGREHRAFNARLAELGYPTLHFERMTKRFLGVRERLLPAMSNLAATAALEHFTATLAEHLLTDPEAQRLLGHRAVQELFLWHALEESEHKAVAFDVYRAVGGSERMRVWTMKGLRFGFVIGTVNQMVVSLIKDRASWRGGNLRRSWKRFKTSGLLSKDLWAQLKDYDRPDFHPDDRDTTELVERFREEFFGPDGTLNDKLVGAAA